MAKKSARKTPKKSLKPAKKPVKSAKRPGQQPKQSAARPKIGDQKQQLFLATLKHAGKHGFSLAAIHAGEDDMRMDRNKAHLLFSNPQRDLLKYFLAWSNEQLADKLRDLPKKQWKVREKVSYGVSKKLELLTPYRDAEKQALLLTARPMYADLSLKTLYDTCDIIWRGAGDTSTDWNFYTKRTLLAGVYTTTLLFWLRDESEDYEDTWQFLSRRIDNVMAINKIKAAFKNRETFKAGFDFLKKFAA